MIGIMQGRLIPPVEGRIQAFPRTDWSSEFENAAASGMDAIEWIFDGYGIGANPLETPEGVACINRLSRTYAVAVRSICADYFMDFPLVRASESERLERLDRLNWLLVQAQQIGVTRMVLPFVDRSAIRDEDDCEAVIDALHRVLPEAERRQIELHLETSLAPHVFAELLARMPTPWVKVNYDSGNSASLGYQPAEELAAYGSRLGSIHIKDRVRGGGTVPLGEGAADFAALFSGLHRLQYSGDYILQVARGRPGDEIAWARHNRIFLERYLN